MRLRFPRACALGILCIARGQTTSQEAKQVPDPHSLVLAGGRFKPLKYDEMTPQQKVMIDHLLAGPRRGAAGPFNVLLRSPEVGDLAAQFGEAMRFRASLPRDIAETVIMMTGRYWMAQFEWNAHKRAALQLGVKPEIVEAIATGKRPTGMPAVMEAAYNFIDELLTTHQVTQATFRAAKELYGEKGIVDMTGLSGWYTIVSTMLDVDEYPMPEGVQPELQPLDNPLPPVRMGFATPIPVPTYSKVARSTVNGKALSITGGRFQPLTYDQMNPEQKKYTEMVVAGRGPDATFNLFLRSPEAGELFYQMGERVQSHMSIPDKLKELALAITARYWGAPHEWTVHSRAAVQAGISEDKANAIAEGRRPARMSADEAAVYNLFAELFKTRQVSDAVFAAAKNQFGERGVVDLLVSSAYCQVVSMFMKLEGLPLSDNQRPKLKNLAKPLP
ncbi:MAG TPA: carboxymuconolactone decarboxylase family protein [Bryobacteraceae bacterium]|nr:carboxymuconolactone decarboxylase family protein [Bryobacteraceae bacterium]